MTLHPEDRRYWTYWSIAATIFAIVAYFVVRYAVLWALIQARFFGPVA